MEETHCGEEAKKARPPKFSFPDRYGKYRRKTKKKVKNNNDN